MDEPEPDAAEPDERERAGVRLRELVADGRVVARPVDLRRHDDQGRRAVPDPPLDLDVRAPLRLVVPAQEAVVRVATIRLVHDRAAGVPEDVDRRDVDDPAGSVPRPRHRASASRSRRWRPPSRGRSDAAIPIRYEPAPWISASAPSRDAAIAAGSRRSSATSVRAGSVGRRPAPGIADEGDDLVAAGEELADDRATDEPPAAGDDDATRISRRACRSRRLRAPA